MWNRETVVKAAFVATVGLVGAVAFLVISLASHDESWASTMLASIDADGAASVSLGPEVVGGFEYLCVEVHGVEAGELIRSNLLEANWIETDPRVVKVPPAESTYPGWFFPPDVAAKADWALVSGPDQAATFVWYVESHGKLLFRRSVPPVSRGRR